MHIVTARVHAAVGGGEGLARLLGNGQGIHIAAEHDDRSSLLVRARAIALGRCDGTGADQANDTGAVNEHSIGNVHLV